MKVRTSRSTSQPAIGRPAETPSELFLLRCRAPEWRFRDIALAEGCLYVRKIHAENILNNRTTLARIAGHNFPLNKTKAHRANTAIGVDVY